LTRSDTASASELPQNSSKPVPYSAVCISIVTAEPSPRWRQNVVRPSYAHGGSKICAYDLRTAKLIQVTPDDLLHHQRGIARPHRMVLVSAWACSPGVRRSELLEASPRLRDGRTPDRTSPWPKAGYRSLSKSAPAGSRTLHRTSPRNDSRVFYRGRRMARDGQREPRGLIDPLVVTLSPRASDADITG
jgi:hypothetical protein